MLDWFRKKMLDYLVKPTASMTNSRPIILDSLDISADTIHEWPTFKSRIHFNMFTIF